MHEIQITAAEAVTAVGSTAATTAASVRAEVSRIVFNDLYPDEQGNALSVALLPNDEGFADPFDRVGPIVLPSPCSDSRAKKSHVSRSWNCGSRRVRRRIVCLLTDRLV